MATIYECDNCGEEIGPKAIHSVIIGLPGQTLHDAEQFVVCAECSLAMLIHLKRNRKDSLDGIRRPENRQ